MARVYSSIVLRKSDVKIALDLATNKITAVAAKAKNVNPIVLAVHNDLRRNTDFYPLRKLSDKLSTRTEVFQKAFVEKYVGAVSEIIADNAKNGNLVTETRGERKLETLAERAAPAAKPVAKPAAKRKMANA